MNRFNCRHDWKIANDYRERSGNAMPSVLKYKKCGVHMSANEAAQIALWKHTVGIQKWLAIVAILVSVIALIISLNS